MMNYTGARCPVCDKKFLENDDVVVCPICGAPHHRDCYDKEGQCAFEEEHISGKAWKSDVSHVPENLKFDENGTMKDPPESPHGDFCIDPKDGSYWDETGVEAKTCAHCGSRNPKDNLYCCSCGNRLVATGANTNSTNYQKTPPTFGNFSNMDPVAAIYGGVMPTEKIGEHTAQEVAAFVNRSSNHFLPRFKAISMNKEKFKLDFNFSAFIFGFLYFFYRKMYKVGIGLLVISIALSIPSMVYTMNNLPEAIVMAYGKESLEQEGLDVEEYLHSDNTTGKDKQTWLLEIFRVLNIVYNMAMGIFANYLYYKFTQGQIKKLKKQRDSSVDTSVTVSGFDVALYKAGGISWTGIVVVFIVLIIGMFGFGNYIINHINEAIQAFPIIY